MSVSLERGSYTVEEGEYPVEVCVVLNRPIERPVTVGLQSSPASASNDSGTTHV